MNPAIIIPAYSREKALQRLLNSICSAFYHDNHKPVVIISLDGGYSEKVEVIADNFFSNMNDKFTITIIKRNINLGLRAHIIECANLGCEYGSFIILEDDLYISKNFYLYSSICLDYYKTSDSIAGISLYSQHYNEYENLPFIPAPTSKYDIFFMQIPSSWGQAWTKEQWVNFITWYNLHKDMDLKSILEIPNSVANWPESSWKKFFSVYLALNEKYFIYPYISHSTNFSDPGGTHNKNTVSMVQVPLDECDSKIESLRLEQLSDNSIKYDPFMERILAKDFIYKNIKSHQISMDIYGSKDLSLLRKKEYALTSKNVSKYIQKVSTNMKPIERDFICLMSDNNKKNNFLYFTETKFIKIESKPSQKIKKLILLSNLIFCNLQNKSFYFSYFASLIKHIFYKK